MGAVELFKIDQKHDVDLANVKNIQIFLKDVFNRSSFKIEIQQQYVL